MYLVIIIKDDKPVPLELVKTDAVANTIINSLVNKNRTVLVFRGPEENLNLASQAIKTSNFGKLPTDQLIRKIAGLGYGIELTSYRDTSPIEIKQNLEYEGFSKLEAQKLISASLINPVTVNSYSFGYNNGTFYHNAVAMPIPANVDFSPRIGPGLTSYPKGMPDTDKHRKIWQKVIKTYKKDIQQQEDFDRQWAMAALLYQRYCLKLRMKPWQQAKVAPKATQDLVKKIKDEDKKVDDYLDKIYDMLDEEGLVKSLGEQSLYGVEEIGGKFVVTLSRFLVTPRNVGSEDILVFLRNYQAFKKSKGRAKKKLTQFCDLEFIEHGNKFRVNTIVNLQMVNAKGLVQSENKILELLKRMFTNWLKTGKFRITKKDRASV